MFKLKDVSGYWVCPKGACWCGRAAGGSPSPGCWSQCIGCAGCSSSSRADWKYLDAGLGTQGQGGTWPGAPADSPLLELSTNLREDSVAGEVAALNKEKALIGAFSGHCETSKVR